jgi:hypothetical protein
MKTSRLKHRLSTILGKPATFRGTDSTFAAFAEKPSIDRMEDNPENISAHDLFSMFTADIIKDKVLFVR